LDGGLTWHISHEKFEWRVEIFFTEESKTKGKKEWKSLSLVSLLILLLLITVWKKNNVPLNINIRESKNNLTLWEILSFANWWRVKGNTASIATHLQLCCFVETLGSYWSKPRNSPVQNLF